MPITIRPERPSDLDAIRRIHLAAFPTPEEADLVDQLRKDGVVLLSLVAEAGQELAGHILFPRMWIDAPEGTLDVVSLAPLAVLPEFQKQGIGSALTREGLARLQAMQERICLVLGHQEYYPRFGFGKRAIDDLQAPFPNESFFSLELVPGALENVRGSIRYPKAFGL